MEESFKKWETVIQAALLRTKMAVTRTQTVKTSDVMVNKDDLIKQSRVLTNEYIDDRLIRSGLNMKQRKLSASFNENSPGRQNMTMTILQELLDKRNNAEQDPLSVDDVSKILICVGEYLELRHNGLYTDVLQHLNVRSIADTNLNGLFRSVAGELFASGITWAKIVSLFAFAGGLAVDCVFGGSSMYVGRVKSWMNEFLQTELMEWIENEGGWIGMFDYFLTREEPEASPDHHFWLLLAIFVVLIVILIVIIAVVYIRRT